MKTYEVRVRGQINREIVCDRVEEASGALTFLAEIDGVTTVVFSVPVEQVIWWQLQKAKGRRIGVRRRPSLDFIAGLRAGARLNKHP